MFDILKTYNSLTIQEQNDFILFLQSPIFNKQPKLVLLLKAMEKFGIKHSCTKEAVYKEIFPAKPFNQRSYRRLEKRLEELMKEFLIYVEIKRRPILQQQLLLESSMRHGLNDIFEHTLNATRRKMKAIAIIDYPHFYDHYLVEETAYRFGSTSQNRNVKPKLKEVSQLLDLHFFINKLRFILVNLSTQKILKQQQKILMLDEVLALLKDLSLEPYPLIQLYHQLVLIFHHFEEKGRYPVFKETFDANKQLLSNYELRQIANFAITYCRLTVMEGKMDFKREEFYYYQLLIERRALYVGRDSVQQRISPHIFRNVVKVGLDMAGQGEVSLTWVADFIRVHKNRVLGQYRDAVFNFAMANLHFAKKDFDQTQDFLAAIQFEEEVIDFFYTIYCKTLQIKTAYELEDWEPMLSSLEALRQYLSRNQKISPDFQAAYDNFRKLVHKLFNKKIGKRIATHDLRVEIMDTKPLREINWLLEKEKTV